MDDKDALVKLNQAERRISEATRQGSLLAEGECGIATK